MINKSFVWKAPKNAELITKSVANINSDSMLVKVEACAVCGSDLRKFNHGNPRVKPGRTVGHEISGVVVSAGKNVSKFKKGDRLSIGADIPCNKPDYAFGHELDGGFAEYIKLNKISIQKGPIQKIKKTTSYDSAALAEPLACSINGYERSDIGTHINNIVIFGAGPIGHMLALLGELKKPRKIIVVDPIESKLKKMKKIINVSTVNSSKKNLKKYILNMTKGVGADLIFTACPSVEAQQTAIDLLAKRGILNFFGGVPQSSKPILLSTNDIHYKEAVITGSHGSTPAQHKLALKLIESGKIKINDLITHKFALSEIREAYKTAASKNSIKVVVNPHA